MRTRRAWDEWIAQLAGQYHVPVIAFTGRAERDERLFGPAGLTEIYEISDRALPLEESMIKERAMDNLRRKVTGVLKR